MNSVWLIGIALCVFWLGYRFYSRFIAYRIFSLNSTRLTPAVKFNDGKDYVPTNKWVVFFYHYATIAGAGVLIGPTLAAQYGWLPCICWILIASCLAGGVHDLVVLVASVRNDGKSIGQIAFSEIGVIVGTAVSIAILFLVATTIAGLSLGVVAALEANPWGTFSVAMTVPIALLMSIYLRWLRPGRVFEATCIGILLMLLALIFGKFVGDSSFSSVFTLSKEKLIVLLAIYSFIAALLPVHVLVVPRNYLNAYIKFGIMILLVFGVLLIHPNIKMPPVTEYIAGQGPVMPGALWPFLFIIITCGAISGWHTLCCSGVTPKIISDERHIRAIAYGGWLLESLSAVLALVLACSLIPQDYFAINASSAAFAKTGMAPVELPILSKSIGLQLQAKPGGATSIAVGIALTFSKLLGGERALAIWYQFAILFLGIWTLAIVDHGTRMSRYLYQECLGHFYKPLGRLGWLPAAIFASAIGTFFWAWLLYTGRIEVLWPIFGICNQLLATIGLAVGTTFILKYTKPIYSLITLLPMLFFAVVSFNAGLLKIKGCLATRNPVATIQAIILMVVILLVAVVLIDSLCKWLTILKANKRYKSV